MRSFRAFFVIAVLAGLAGGAWLLEAIGPLPATFQWVDIPLAMLGLAVTLLQLLALQASAGRRRTLQWGWQVSVLVGAVLVAAGVSALAMAMARSELLPESFLFLALGSALLLAAAGLRRMLPLIWAVAP